jgi:hypothetical protein
MSAAVAKSGRAAVKACKHWPHKSPALTVRSVFTVYISQDISKDISKDISQDISQDTPTPLAETTH